MSDLISRQAAIDAIEEYFEGLPIVVHYDMLEMVKALSSVQPELPIKEKCCYCPHCANCDVNDDLTINQQEQRWIPFEQCVEENRLEKGTPD